MARLPEVDADWAARVAARGGRGPGAALRVTATPRGVSARLTSVAASSPIGALQGTRNLVAFTTRRYRNEPLVISGPGAGAEVTAAGILNDIYSLRSSTQSLTPRRSGRSVVNCSMPRTDISTDTMLRLILTSRVYDVAHETPLEPAAHLSRRLQNQVLLKREDLQPVFSYKLRGAYNRIAHLTDAERARGVIAASAGNHAQGVAYAARHLGLRALIVMPQTTPEIKVEAVRALGAEVVLAGDSYADAKTRCDELVAETGLAFVHPFDDPLVIAGQGTIGERDPAAQARGRLGDLRAGRRRRA